MKTITTLIALLFAFTSSYAQQDVVRLGGKVISFEESLALEGVSVNVKGTNNYSGTQADGTFNISVKPEDKILVFSLPEYETKEIAISSTTEYDIILKRKGTDAAAASPVSRKKSIEMCTTK